MSSGKGIDNVNQDFGNLNLRSSKDGDWEEVSRKQKGKAGRKLGQQTSTPPKAWGQGDTAQRLGMRGGKGNAPNNYPRKQGDGGMRSQPGNKVMAGARGPPLKHGWNWAARTGSPRMADEDFVEEDDVNKAEEEEDDDSFTDDDDDVLFDDYDSDDGPQTHEARKQQRMLKDFFDILDKLTEQEINDPGRQWHCPACQGGPGAIDWYKGLNPLVSHAKTKGTKRVKLHREFAIVLDEELRRRGASLVMAGEAYGQWEGLKQEINDPEIVWPPMVVIMNTLREKDDDDKWVGMGSQELLDYFQGYAASKARHSYGPRGHRGLSILIFEASAMGYLEAERLHKHFLGQGTGRNAWESNRKLFYEGGKRQLYGFLARKDDLDEFNKHCQGKAKLKFDMRSYHEMVVIPMKKMSDDNQQLTYYQNKVTKEQRNSKALEESLSIVSQKLRKTVEDNRIVRKRTQIQHEQNKEEMDFQEQFFQDQIKQIHDSINMKEANFEKLQQEERKKVEVSSNAESSVMGDHRRRAEEASQFKELQDQEMDKFVVERDELINQHENKKMEMKKKHWEEEIAFEKEFDLALTKLMDNYAPSSTC